MRKSFKWILTASLVAFAVIGCAKQGDLEKVVSRVDNIENRVGVLEEAVKQLNETDVPGLRELVRAIQNNITVTSVVETEDGYTINFSDGTSAVLRNGKNGKDGRDGVDGIDGVDGEDGTNGTDGVDGVDGETPVIGITLVDGVYVWTVNGDILKDNDGKPIPVTGNDGKDGTNGTDGTDGVTPLFGILDGHWVVSYDNGDTWKTLGLTSDTDYSAYIDPDKETDDYIVLVVGATEVQIPKEKAFTLTFTTIQNNGVNAGETVAFPYTIAGVNASDETDVDVIGIIGDWTAEVVPTDNASGVLNVTATENGTAKVTVYAANHKGKADIRTLKFEGGVLEAVIETHDIEWEGGELNLFVKTNVAYDVVVPADAQEWISVAPATRVRVDSLLITVAKNETGAYRQATLKVVDSKGVSVKDIEILQYANPEAATDLASVAALPDDKAVAVNQVTVVAASKVSTIVTDGEAFMYVTNYTGTPGTVIDVTGTKKTDDFELAFVEASEVKVNAEAEPVEVDEKANYLYFGMGANGYTYFFTSNNGIVSEEGGVYYVTGYVDPQQFVIEDPTQDLSALVGKIVAMSGWVKTVEYEEDVKEDIFTVLTDIHEVNLTPEAGWKPYYGGPNSGESGYPEVIGNEVSNPQEDVYYALNVVSAADAEEYGSVDNLLLHGILEASDNVLYYLWMYNYVYELDFDTAFGYLAYNDSETESYREFPYGTYYIIAAGVDELGRLTGKYAISAFEKEDPTVKMAYEDFLGTWSVNGTEWTISQKENGVSYNIDGIPGSSSLASRGGNTTVVAQYDAESGTLYAIEQELAAYDDPSVNNYGPLKDFFSGVFAYGSRTYRNYPVNGDPAVVFTMVGLKDGTCRMDAGECDYGTFVSFQFQWIIQTGEYAGAGNVYGSPVTLPISGITKVNKVAGKYEDFLGTWTVGEDQWTVTEKKAGETYNLAGVYGSDKLYSGSYETIEAGFDAEKGEFFVMDQYLGEFNSDDISAFSNNPYGMCSDNVCGIFVYGDSAYSGYPNNGITTPGRIFTGALDPSGAVQLTPGSCRYGTYAALGFSWSILTGESAGNGNYYGSYVTVLPATMVKASAGSSSVRTAKQEGKASVTARLSASSDKAVASPKVSKPAQEKAPARESRRLLKF